MLTTHLSHTLGAGLRWLVRKRVAISALAFASVLAISVLLGTRPREFAHGHDLVSLLSTAALLAGLAIRSWAAGTLVKNKELTTSGPYRLIRNPLYAGSFLMMFGACGLMDHWLAPLLMVVSILLIYQFTVHSEERRLHRAYGQAWTEYARRTPRFVPRTLSFDFSNWRVSQWLKNREYAAVLTTALVMVLIELWEQLAA